ncbi:hypothetical protein BU26DRAFT_534209 [Trematosphaeria pertusa]|uniref:Uncharacterized protein n=1 Tax=Trematosphaeria pertusa TaxID=390896 RepID=A0A6A6HYC4_9PLEO|nr:uncharacterized protein BU26DRAFT_534209 [Trematosphaeria pertusa]KAF2243215.1 hypothetical protein BU26DRAFT_534209 [Trematosphaeria pertusa]
MRAIAALLCIVTHAWTVNANVEKTIFVAPSPVALPNVRPGLDDLRLDILDAAHAPILATKLAVQFPTEPAPRGLESWYILRNLQEGRRYEVRICWPATQPTDFWLDTYPLTHVLDTPNLLSSLAEYSEFRQALELEPPESSEDEVTPESQYILFLRIQAAASYYSTNRTLMDYPPLVDADIILDPYTLNVLPRSLVPTAIYISIASVAAWFLSGYIYRWLLSVALERPSKDHAE